MYRHRLAPDRLVTLVVQRHTLGFRQLFERVGGSHEKFGQPMAFDL